MPGKRKEAEAYILKWVDEIAPGGHNRQIYIDKFAKMSDDEFEAMVKGIEDGSVHLAVIAPNFHEARLTTENNFRVAKLLGHNFFQQINVPAKGTQPGYLTPIPYLIMDLPVRRQAQLLEKKISIPEHNNSVDDFTGQPTGASKGSKISYPETQVMAALGLDVALTEFLKYRGGDEKGFNAMNLSIARTGGASLRGIAPFAGGVKSTQTLKSYLTGMHLRTTL